MDARAAILVAVACAAGCRDCGPPRDSDGEQGGRACRASLDGGIRSFLDAHEVEYLASRSRARRWLDDLDVDPALLRSRGIKGKKKLVELLDAYVWLLRDPLEGEADELRARAAQIVAPTADASFHDMSTVSDEQFKQDATSYMRAAYLMDGLGMDTSGYVEQMRRILPRLNEHMASRGPAQQMIFHSYYEHFGFEEPFPLGNAFSKGRIASREDPGTLERMPIYHLTHEIFMPFMYGEVRETEFFDEADIEYLAGALPVLVERRIAVDDPDLVAELVLCLEYLDLEREPAYERGIEYLLGSQNEDGSWGSYPEADRRFGTFARHHIYLHTTKLALSALVNAFRCPG